MKVELGSVWRHRTGITGKVVEVDPRHLMIGLLVENEMHLSIRRECLEGECDMGGVLGGWKLHDAPSLSPTRTPGYFVVDAEPLESAGVVRLTIRSGTVDFAILIDPKEAISLHRAVAHAARAVEEAAA